MYKRIFLLVAVYGLASFVQHALGQTWVPVGTPGFSANISNWVSLSIDKNNTPYVVYQDDGNAAKATVMKYNGSNWVPLGIAGFTANQAFYTSIAIDNSSGTPYVAFQDYNNFTGSSRATVMKYDGTNWVTVGSPGVSTDTAKWVSIAIDRMGTPYVVFEDWSSGRRATVMEYSGGSWVVVGTPGFTAGAASYTAITIDTSGTPYVAYQDGGNYLKTTVMKFNGVNWVTVGSSGFSSHQADWTRIAIDRGGTLYVAFNDSSASTPNQVTVMKYDGIDWTSVGIPCFSAGSAWYTSLAIDKTGAPYVAYWDTVGSYQANVMKYDGGSWVPVGTVDFPTGEIQFTSIAIDSGGIPYVAYQDAYYGERVTVIKLDTSIRTLVNSIAPENNIIFFPNPTKSELTISSLNRITTVSLSNLMGQIIFANQYNSSRVQIDVADLPAGVYFIKTNGSEMTKFVKE